MRLTIRETAQTPTGFTAEIAIDDGAARPVTLRDPFDKKQEAELEWYFETWLNLPFINTVRAEKAAASVAAYGLDLFKQVIEADNKLYARYVQGRNAGLSGLALEIVGSPAFHALHWEALRDPDLARPLALDCAFVRRNKHWQDVPATLRQAPTLNVLLVTARPGGRQDVGYRTISRPLVEALENSALRARIDLVRPGTYEALVQHLEDVRDRHGEGYYHLVHFDLHGALLDYAAYAAYRKLYRPSAHLFQYGLPDLPPFEGVKAFLFFDGAAANQPVPAEASQIAGLLQTHRAPVAVLNACQSGKQVGASETSLGSRLMAAGVQVVVAMGYSVTVTAAQKLMTELYTRLLGGDELATAIRRGRLRLHDDKERQAAYRETIELEDWVLPVVYQNSAVTLQPTGFATPEEEAAFYQRRAARYRAPAVTYGFVGRDVDILEIESLLLGERGHNVLLVRGMGGAGKTTLLRHLAQWWQTTGLVREVAYFGYDAKAYTAAQIVDGVAQRVWGERAYIRELQPFDFAVRQQKVVERLRAERHLLILDNLESITGSALAVQNTLPAAEQARLRGLVQALAGGKTLLLLGSRAGEEWLVGTRAPYLLPGLDPQAASDLAEAVLQRHGAAGYRSHPAHRDDFRRLLALLGGFPLALEVVLANLARQTPGEVLAALAAADVKLDTPDPAADKTQSILKCIEYSHSNLSEPAQRLLLTLAPFSNVVNGNLLGNYVGHLQQQALLADWDWPQLGAVIQEAVNWGLLAPHEAGGGYLRLQPILPYFLKTRLRAAEAGVTAALEAAFRAHYDEVGGALAQWIRSKQAQERQLGQALIGLEYENLMTALHYALGAQATILNLYSPLSFYIDSKQDQKLGLALGQTVLPVLEMYEPTELVGQRGAELVGVVDNIASRFLLAKQYAEAEAAYLRALTLMQGIQGVAENMKARGLASIYHQLGMVAQAQRQWDSAERTYQQALQIFRDFDDRYSQASTLHQLGRVAQEQRQWESAERYYQQALQIFRDFDDRYSQATILHNLGAVAQEQRQWESAERTYQQALQIYRDFDDRHGQARLLHSLGRVAQEQRQWDSAERTYQQALQIFRDFDDRYSQASTLHQLGRVAQAQRQWESAERTYQQALQIYRDFDDTYEQAKTLHNLGAVAQAQRQWDSAERYYQQALQIYRDFDDRYSQASTLHQLGRVAEAQRQWDSAERYYQQALQIKRDFDDRYSQASTLHQLGRVAEEQRQWDSAERYYQQALQICRDFDDRYSQASTLHQLGMVAQAQRQWDAAERTYQQALQIYRDFDDTYEQAGTLHQLGMVAQAQRQWDAAERTYQQALQIYRDFDDRHGQARLLHSLGIVAQEQRQWESAERTYQQALQILRDFDDRYSQASTYGQLGLLNEAQGNWAESANYLLQALEIFRDFGDQHNLGQAISIMARIWQAGADATIPTRLAALLGVTPAEAEAGLRQAAGS